MRTKNHSPLSESRTNISPRSPRREQKKDIAVFMAITFLFYIAANLAHPVTPTLIVELGLDSSVFGMAFASMSFTSFLFSPFWGKICQILPVKTVILIGCIGYGSAQFLFGIAGSAAGIIGARLLAGLFMGSISVATMIYIVDISGERVAQSLSRMTVVQSLGGAAGFLAGGFLGHFSLLYSFFLQTFLLLFCGGLYYRLLRKLEKESSADTSLRSPSIWKEINPFRSFFSIREYRTPVLVTLFLVSALTALGATGFDQNFNFYLKKELHFSSQYNGAMKSAVGMVTLLVNATLYVWMSRRMSVYKATAALLFLLPLSILAVILSPDVFTFFALSLGYYSLHAVFSPLFQNAVTQNASANKGVILGFYHSTKSLGMILGALTSGFLYSAGAKIPFYFSAFCFLLSFFILLRIRNHRD